MRKLAIKLATNSATKKLRTNRHFYSIKIRCQAQRVSIEILITVCISLLYKICNSRSIHAICNVIITICFMLLQISFDECNKSVNCLKYPKGCKSFTTCKSVALYFFNKETSQVHIQLTSKDKWVAFGQVLKTAPNFMVSVYI